MAACSDPRISDGQFRMMYRVAAAANAQTAVAVISDPVIMDEVPNSQTPSTCRKNRRAVEAIGYWTTRPGHGRKGEANAATEYAFLSQPIAAVAASTDAKREKRQERKRRDRLAWKARKRGEAANGTPSTRFGVAEGRSIDITPPQGGEAKRTGGGEAIWRRGVIRPDRDSPSYTPSTIQEADEESVEISARESLSPDQIEDVVLRILGDGDLADGRDLADYVPGRLLRNAVDRSARYGVELCRQEIQFARTQAMARREAERRASA